MLRAGENVGCDKNSPQTLTRLPSSVGYESVVVWFDWLEISFTFAACLRVNAITPSIAAVPPCVYPKM